jgi:DnaJ domain
MPRDSDYDVLGLRPGASLDDVRQAHRDLVKVWHPDRFSTDPRLQARAQEKLQEINAAYDRLRVLLPSPGTRSQPSSSPPPRPPSSPPPPPRPAASAPPRPPRSPSHARIPRKNRELVVVGLALVVVLGSQIWRHDYHEDRATHPSPIPRRPPQSDSASPARPTPPPSPATTGPSAASTPRVETPPEKLSPGQRTRLEKSSADVVAATKNYRAALERVLGIYERELARLAEQVELRKDLYERGVLKRQEFDEGLRAHGEARKNVAETRRAIEDTDRLLRETREAEELARLSR